MRVWEEGREALDGDVAREEVADTAGCLGVAIPDVGFGCELRLSAGECRGEKEDLYHGDDEDLGCDHLALLGVGRGVADEDDIRILGLCFENWRSKDTCRREEEARQRGGSHVETEWEHGEGD